MSPERLRCVLITPARNEEAFLEGTIRSVLAQTVRPDRWIIVSDGSTDRTDEIAAAHAAAHDFIEFLRMPDHADRQFAAKVHCFEAGFRRIADSSFDIVGNLDADLTFEPGYLEYLLEQFARNPRLGVAGTPFVEEGSSYDYRFTNIEHVSGACQLFRRKCFEDIGGYRPIEGGGIDWVAVTSARMKGWQTRTFTDKVLVHHRKMGTGKGNRITALFRQGRQDYYLGNHPLWEFLRMFYQMRFRPAVVGGLTLFSGYCLAALARVKSPVPKDLAAFIRREQMQRLRSKLPIPGRKGRG
ncbi:MAG TPA: glycosyltransferase family 2 protein [Candidatus Aminicenantes bacterium]|nr:glycosyltransferase family 2 protein [Candidatus Aminicenantes bacterium]HRY64875.1 glycosyltransferase family 2 protein [Candidatus Aminicenantes bacterium]HRZ71788.1 glycosyltransferase family 2 protein [Candidatus Aminicenantes bacterium]